MINVVYVNMCKFCGAMIFPNFGGVCTICKTIYPNTTPPQGTILSEFAYNQQMFMNNIEDITQRYGLGTMLIIEKGTIMVDKMKRFKELGGFRDIQLTEGAICCTLTNELKTHLSKIKPKKELDEK